MISFRNERVLSFDLDYLDVLWEVVPTTEDLQEYQFFVERSEAEAGPWDQIAGPMVDTYRFRDTATPQITTNARSLFYRVKAVHSPTGREHYSSTFDQEGKISLLAKEMVRRERILFEEFVGTRCWVFPRRTFGQKCPSCYDPVMDKVIDDQCATCWSTGFSGGYHHPIAFWAQIDSPEQTEQVSLEDHRRVLYYTMRCGPSPALKPMDLVIDYQNRRHRVVSVSGTSRLGVTVRQEVRLVQIQRGSIEDRVPLKIDLEALQPFPEREFSNPHNLEASEPGYPADPAPDGSLLYYNPTLNRPSAPSGGTKPCECPEVLNLIVVPFSFDTPSPLTISALALTQFVVTASIQITTPFEDSSATLALGTDSSSGEFLTEQESTPTRIGTYASEANFLVSTEENCSLVITPGTSSAGAGVVILDLRNTTIP